MLTDGFYTDRDEVDELVRSLLEVIEEQQAETPVVAAALVQTLIQHLQEQGESKDDALDWAIKYVDRAID